MNMYLYVGITTSPCFRMYRAGIPIPGCTVKPHCASGWQAMRVVFMGHAGATVSESPKLNTVYSHARSLLWCHPVSVVGLCHYHVSLSGSIEMPTETCDFRSSDYKDSKSMPLYY